MNPHFQLFGLPERFALDEAGLDSRYRVLAAQFHPDRSATASAFEQRQAVMMAAAVNEAYRVLRNPFDRAASLLQGQGIEADAPAHTAFPPEFLMQQMDWREQLAEARATGNEAALSALAGDIAAAREALCGRLQAAFEGGHYEDAAQRVRQGRFLDKMAQEIAAALP